MDGFLKMMDEWEKRFLIKVVTCFWRSLKQLAHAHLFIHTSRLLEKSHLFISPPADVASSVLRPPVFLAVAWPSCYQTSHRRLEMRIRLMFQLSAGWLTLWCSALRDWSYLTLRWCRNGSCRTLKPVKRQCQWCEHSLQKASGDGWAPRAHGVMCMTVALFLISLHIGVFLSQTED